MVAGTIERKSDAGDVWTRLREPIAREQIQWRIDGKPTERDGGWYARQVAWADVPVVVRRLDDVVPGEWSFTAEVLGPCTTRDNEKGIAIKGRLSILGVAREDIGVDTDEKAALSDAFKRTARLFGIALELWSFPQSWVQVSGDGKYAKIVGDSWEAHDRALARRDGTPAPRAANGNGARKKTAPRSADLPALPEWPTLDNGTDRESSVGQAARIKQLIEAGNVPESVQTKIRKSLVAHAGDLANMGRIISALEKQYFAPANVEESGANPQPASAATPGDSPESNTASGSTRKATADVPPCPKCGGKMWDNRIGKKNPKAPDFKCRDRSCGGVIWPAKEKDSARGSEPAPSEETLDENEIPF